MKNDSKFSRKTYITYKLARRNKTKTKPILGEADYLIIYTFIQFLRNKTVVNAPYLFLRNVDYGVRSDN